MKEPGENFREYRRYTTEKSANRDGVGYGLEVYKLVFPFTNNDLRNSTILDLGSGPIERLSKDIENLGINCKVISINPEYSENEYLRLDNQKENNRGSVAAIGQELPFRPEAFKFIFALNSISLFRTFY